VAALVHIPAHLGYIGLFLLVGAESTGIPLPGETALITAAVLSRDGSVRIEVVIVLAALAAIVGDNLGYLLGRRFGRRVMTRPGRWSGHRERALATGQAFFDRHGPKAVFFGRFVAALRIWAAWIAGMTHMPWRTFLFWNALGGVVWATLVGLAGYFAGQAAGRLIERAGVAAAVATLAVGVIALLLLRRSAERRLP
jgi:membrane-associated protein